MVDDPELITGASTEPMVDGAAIRDERHPQTDIEDTIWRSMDLPGMDGDGDVAVTLAEG
jgi:hypothetical protein